MKLLPLLLCFAVLSTGLAQAPPKDYYKGTLTYLDGKTEETYIKCPFGCREKKIKIFSPANTEKSKVDADELKSVSFTTKKGTFRFDYLHIAAKKGKPTRKDKNWLYYSPERSCPALSFYLMGDGFDIDRQDNVGITTSRSTTYGNTYVNYYLKKSTDKNANGIGGKVGNKYWQWIFKDDPEILKRMKEGKYSTKGKEKFKRMIQVESKTLIIGDQVEAVADDYCELHKEK